jgi:hypothetical protein
LHLLCRELAELEAAQLRRDVQANQIGVGAERLGRAPRGSDVGQPPVQILADLLSRGAVIDALLGERDLFQAAPAGLCLIRAVARNASTVRQGDAPLPCAIRALACAAGMRRWLLVRCAAKDPDEHAYFLAFGPEGTTEAELVGVCTTRWQIEEGFAQAKGEVGLDQYEVRTWEAWHRHVTLCLLAHAYLVVLRQAAQQEERGQKGAPTPA